MDAILVRRLVAACAIALGLSAPAHAGPIEPAAERMLKEVYLACERRASLGPAPGGEVARCSAVYEELKTRVFGGDWRRVRDWSRMHLGPGRST